MSDKEEEGQIENTIQDEVQRLKDMETQNNDIQRILNAQMDKNQNYEQIFLKISALLGEVLKSTAQTTYIITMAKDIIDNRNITSS